MTQLTIKEKRTIEIGLPQLLCQATLLWKKAPFL